LGGEGGGEHREEVGRWNRQAGLVPVAGQTA
jgi:hypothetical protein